MRHSCATPNATPSALPASCAISAASLPRTSDVLNSLTAEGLRRTLISVNREVRAAGQAALLFVFYSGHADAEALHLRGSKLALSELRDLVYGSPADVRILIIDACRSGVLTRVKGGSRQAGFKIQLDDQLSTEGTATLTSSAAGEESQESDRLRASFFTHYLASALLGAADRDENGKVTLSEAFSYARDRTLAATAATVVGPQHPTFRFNLGGREDLVLTWPAHKGQQFGFLSFDSGTYLVHRSRSEGAIVAEVSVSEGRRRLALEPGRYFVVRRARSHLRQRGVHGSSRSGHPGGNVGDGAHRIRCAWCARAAATATRHSACWR